MKKSVKKSLLIIIIIIALFFLIPWIVDHFTRTNLGTNILNLAVTPAINDSGLLSTINQEFQNNSTIRVNLIVRDAETCIQLACEGNTDALIVNAEVAEKQLVADGFGINRTKICYRTTPENKNSDSVKPENIFHIIGVNPTEHPQVNNINSEKYIKWLVSPEVQKLIGEYKKEGKILFQPPYRTDKK